jgi:hypothetical protein
VNQAIVNITKPHPRSRYGSIINLVQGDEFGKSRGLSQDALVSQFVDLGSKPVCVQADVLPPTQIKMQKDVFTVASETDFFRGIARKKFHRIPEIGKVILLFNDSEKERVLNFYQQLRTLSAGHGLIFPKKPKPLSVQTDNHGNMLTGWQRTMKRTLCCHSPRARTMNSTTCLSKNCWLNTVCFLKT